MSLRVQLAAEGTKPPACPVSHNSTSETFSHGNEGSAQVGVADANGHPPAPIEPPPVEELPNFSPQPEVGPAHRLSGKAFAPFTASSVEYLTSAGAAHPVPKAVLVFSLSFAGLKRPFHWGYAFQRAIK